MDARARAAAEVPADKQDAVERFLWAYDLHSRTARKNLRKLVADAVAQAVKDCPKCEGYRENAKVVIDQQAEEIARLNDKLDEWQLRIFRDAEEIARMRDELARPIGW